MNRAYLLLAIFLVAVLAAGCNRTTRTEAPSPSPPAVAGAPTSVPTAAPPTRTPAASPTPSPKPSPTEFPTDEPNPTGPTDRPVPTFGPLDPEIARTMGAIGDEMERIRGLTVTQPLTYTVMSRTELAEYLENHFEEEYSPEEIEDDVRVLAAFDFVPEDYDLLSVVLDLYSRQVLGLYDDEANTLYTVSDAGLDLVARMTVAHEYTHGLQDEYFQLDTFLDEDRMNGDELLARRALIEGDASIAMGEYLMAHLSEVTEADLAALQSNESQAGQSALEDAPPIIRETFAFPYIYGQPFVEALRRSGWAAVDAAYADPPASTEQILHVEKYLRGDEPQIVSLPPLTDTLGAGWELADADTLGEFQLALYLDQQTPEAVAWGAAEGWDGDQYAVYVHGDDEVLVLSIVWDSPADREEFITAYTAYADAKYGREGSARGDTTLTWETPEQTAYIAWDESMALIILGPDRTIVDSIVSAVQK